MYTPIYALESYYTYTHILVYMYTCKNRERQLIKEQKYPAIAVDLSVLRNFTANIVRSFLLSISPPRIAPAISPVSLRKHELFSLSIN